MAIKVSFLTGANTATVSGLYQWDYGQVLEIECAEIASEIVEVHFACANMSEAIVRTCAFTNGVGTVTIPDECLEQTSAVTAWVYKVDSTQGHTIKAITLPITARTRPSNTRSVPADYNDKYGQLIEEVNEAIDAIENGNVTAAKALSAKSADHATSATSAASATYATSAGHANTANTVNSVQLKPIATVQINSNTGTLSTGLTAKVAYLVLLDMGDVSFSGIFMKMTNTHATFVALGDYILNVGGLFVTLSGGATSAYGTLYFYKIGDLS